MDEEQPSTEEWEAHFQSLETEVLLDLLASQSLLHRKMVREIVVSRGVSGKDINEAVKERQKLIDKSVRKSPSLAIEKDPISDGPISPDVYAWRNLFLLAILFFMLSVALSVISWIYFGFLAGLCTLAACIIISIFLSAISEYFLQKLAIWEYDRDRSRR